MEELPNHLYYAKGAENEVKILFVMESPHTEELREGIAVPCVGRTGLKMTEKLCPGETQPLGMLIMAGNNEIVKKYALFETFKFPLSTRVALDAPLSFEKEMWRHLKCYETVSWSECEKVHNRRKKHYENLKRFINVFNNSDGFVLNDYKESLINALTSLPNLEEIAVCGFIAQSVFMETFCISDPGYRTRRQMPIAGKSVNVYFTSHPAHNANWDYE